MEEAVLVLHLFAVVALIVLVLIQKSEGGALGIGGGGGMGGLFSARGAANVLTRATAILAVVFFATSLGLALMAQQEGLPSSILDRPVADQPAAPGPSDAGAGQGQGGDGILDTLRQRSEPAPSGPQVPSSQ